MARIIVPNDVAAHLHREGYYVARARVSRARAVQFVLDVGRSLGDLFVPNHCDPAQPVIRTTPARTHHAAPFDRPAAIGWHGDFATYEDRPELSLVYITRADPRGGFFGAWRLASVVRVVELLRATRAGQISLDLLSEEPLPFSYADGEEPRRFKVIETRSGGILGLRLYLPSIHRGCLAEYGKVPSRVARALSAVMQAADEVSETVPTQEGSLLVASNWFALHDRLRQTISHSRPNREALLCFVARRESLTV